MKDKERGGLASVVVPVYNGCGYLDRMIKSVAAQTYRPIELIAVDDGSSDDSYSFLLAEKRKLELGGVGVILLHQENAGIAASRNAGLAASSGEYILFMDQDDWLEPDYVETLVGQMVCTKADIVIGGYRLIDDKGRVRERRELDPENAWSKYRITSPWGRVFRKSVITEKKISFALTKISEDLYFNLLFLSYASRVAVTSYVGYNWYYNEKSESRKNWRQMSEERNPLPMLSSVHERIKDSKKLKEEELTYFFTKYLVWYLLYSSRGADSEMIRKRYTEVFGWLEKLYPAFGNKAITGFRKPEGELWQVRLCVSGCLWLYRRRMLLPFLKLYGRF